MHITYGVNLDFNLTYPQSFGILKEVHYYISDDKTWQPFCATCFQLTLGLFEKQDVLVEKPCGLEQWTFCPIQVFSSMILCCMVSKVDYLWGKTCVLALSTSIMQTMGPREVDNEMAFLKHEIIKNKSKHKHESYKMLMMLLAFVKNKQVCPKPSLGPLHSIHWSYVHYSENHHYSTLLSEINYIFI